MNFARKRIFITTLVVGMVDLLGCNYSLERDITNLKILSNDNLIIATPSSAEIVNGEFQLKQNATAQLGCLVGADGQLTTGSGDAGVAMNSTAYQLGFVFSFDFLVKPTAVALRLTSTGAPTVSALVNITGTSGLAPVSSNILASTNSISMGTVASGSYSDKVFTFSSSPALSANTAYGLVLAPVTGSGSMDGSNNISWSRGDSASDCSSYQVMYRSSNVGVSWGPLSTAPYFNFQVPGYASTGTGYWIVDGEKLTTWDLSSFTVEENPSGDKNGEVTYSLGAGSDSSTPSYTLTNLTLAQVRSSANLTGQYLYIQIELASTHNNLVNAGTGSGYILKVL